MNCVSTSEHPESSDSSYKRDDGNQKHEYHDSLPIINIGGGGNEKRA